MYDTIYSLMHVLSALIATAMCMMIAYSLVHCPQRVASAAASVMGFDNSKEIQQS